MKSKKQRTVEGAELEELRHIWSANKQAEMMHRGTWWLWGKAATTIAKRFRIPVKSFHIDLKTGEVGRRDG